MSKTTRPRIGLSGQAVEICQCYAVRLRSRGSGSRFLLSGAAGQDLTNLDTVSDLRFVRREIHELQPEITALLVGQRPRHRQR